MKLAKYVSPSGKPAVGRVEDNHLLPLHTTDGPIHNLAELLDAEDPYAMAEFMTHSEPVPLSKVELLAPIDQQEVWAAGVTYKRSKVARMEESETAASCYDRVYASPRPEIFYKASPHRCSGPNKPLRIRVDSDWNVPEPELTLVLNSRLELVGYTIGNDMSSRDIEGDNPLYLPQAKVYNQCCGLGPWITLARHMPPPAEIGIALAIHRHNAKVFEGHTSVSQMARSFENLIGWLGRDQTFPNGCFLLTGTGIVPDNSFTLHAGDVVEITIDGIGTLKNPIVRG
ncbi:fumarylacetoacetate hydrolase family protein [Anatilimnocola sp. NA78]|uniref:fumarylacetoacetate hydrolase family protein n=1 Tax=Anatilimnocola sp. NA78 TaxID=3415683 RepID=UPI003CE4BCB7